MSLVFKPQYLANFLVAIWITSLLFRNAFYQVSTVLIIIFSFFIIYKAKSKTSAIEALSNISSLLLAMVLIITTSLLSNLQSEFLSSALLIEQIKMILRYGAIFLALYLMQIYGYINVRFLAKFITFLLLLVGINGIIQLLTGTGILGSPLHPDGAVTSLFENPNPFGLLSLVFSAVTMYFFSTTSGYAKALSLLLHLFALFCIVISESRAPLVAYFTFILIFGIFQKKNIILIVSLALVTSFFALINPELSSNIMSIFRMEDSNRFEIWTWAFKEANSNWLFGHGLNAFKLIPSAPEYGFIHNSILDVYFHYGVIGLFSHGVLFFICMKYAFEQYNKIVFAFGGSLFTLSLFDYSPTSGKLFLSVLTIYVFFLAIKRNNLMTKPDFPANDEV